MLRLRTLGSIGLTDSNGEEIPTVLAQPKRFALLVYLTIAKPEKLHRRDILLSLFWPESDEAHGRNALSQSLSFLRKHISHSLIIGRGLEDVGVDSAVFWSDVAAFRLALEDERWKDALNLYGGDLLPGFHVSGAWGFEEWLAGERERLREEAAGAAWALAEAQIRQGRLVEAERTGQRATSLVWSDETPVRDFMEALAMAGDKVAALNFYERFRQRIRDELDVDPAPETQAVADTIRAGHHGPQPVEFDSPFRRGQPPRATLSGPSGAPLDQDTIPEPEAAQIPTPRPSERDPGSGPWKLWFWSLTFAAVVCFGAIVIARARGLMEALGPPPEDRPFALLADVEGTASEELREAVAFLLRTGLDMAHVVQTVPIQDVERVLALMEKNQDTWLEPSVAREVAIRLGVSSVLLPRLDRLGSDLVLALRAEEVQTGRLRGEARRVSGEEERVVQMVDEVVREVRRDLGEARRTLVSSPPLPRVVTPSLEALRHYREAGILAAQAQTREARTHLWRAVALDSAFAMAWQGLADSYLSHPRHFDSATYAADRGRQFWDRLTEARRADALLHSRIHTDIALWDEAFHDAGQAVQRDPAWSQAYALRLSHEGGMPDSAWTIYLNLEVRRIQAARQFDPELAYSTPCYFNHLKQSVSLDRTREWLDLLDSLQVHMPPDCARDLDFYESMARGDWDRADSLLEANTLGWRWPSGIQWTSRQLLAVRGRVREAHAALGPGDLPTFGVPETQRTRLSHLFLDLVFDRPRHRRGPDEAPMELAGRGKFPVVDYLLYGLRHGFLGDTLEARRVSHRLRVMRDTATSRIFERNFQPWFTLLEVAPSYRREDWDEVVARVEPLMAEIYDPGIGGYLPGAAFLSWWILAEAYEANGHPRRAIEYLEAYFTRPSRRLDDWAFHGFFRPSARLKLGRLYGQVGDTARAYGHFQAFLEVFTDPDPEYQWMVDEARLNLRVPPPTRR